MRQYKHIDAYLDRLALDIYPQPADKNHTRWAKAAIELMLPREGLSVLDVGCGSKGFCEPLFNAKGCSWHGVSLDPEENENPRIKNEDISFLSFDDGSFDLIFARHILEHSPMPLLTLMEWHRVSNQWAIIVLPSFDYWGVGGRNHYYVLDKKTWWALFDFAGWRVSREGGLNTAHKLWADYYPNEENPTPYPLPPKEVELWFLLEKK